MKLILFFFMTLFSSSCHYLHQTPDLGYREGNTYHHDYFGFQLIIPSEWHFQSEKIANYLKNAKLNPQQLGAFEKWLDPARQEMITLASIFAKKAGSPSSFNASFLITAEKTHWFSTTANRKNYLERVKSLLMNFEPPYQFDKPISIIKLDGVMFDVLEGKSMLYTKPIYQIHFTTIRRGYFLNLIAIYQTSEERKKIEEMITSMRFNIGLER